MRVTRQATRQIQECSIRVLLDSGDIVRIRRIERDLDGELYVRTPRGQRYSVDHIVNIVNPRGES